MHKNYLKKVSIKYIFLKSRFTIKLQEKQSHKSKQELTVRFCLTAVPNASTI